MNGPYLHLSPTATDLQVMRAVGPLPEDDGRHVGRHGLPQSPQEGGHAHAEQGRGRRRVQRRDEELPKEASTYDIHTFFCSSAPQI